MLEATAQVTAGRRCPMLVNMMDPGRKTEQHERMDTPGRPDVGPRLVVNTPLSRVMGTCSSR